MGKLKAKILLIDDDQMFLTEAVAFLEELDYIAIPCRDTRESLRMIRSQCPDCIIMDLRMPHLEGEDLLPLISKQFPDTPVIVCTGSVDMNERFLIGSGAWGILQKPFNLEDMVQTIDQAISGKESSTILVFKDLHLLKARNLLIRRLVAKALAKAHSNIDSAAKFLALKPRTLERLIKRFKI